MDRITLVCRIAGWLLLGWSLIYGALAGGMVLYAYYLLFEASPFSFAKEGAIFFVFWAGSLIAGPVLLVYSYRRSKSHKGEDGI